MKSIYSILFAIGFALFVPNAAKANPASYTIDAGSLYVIVNKNLGLNELSKKHVMGLFLGRSRSFPKKGGVARPFDLPTGSEQRKLFFELLTGKSISDIDAYWARLRYSGRATPPRTLEGYEAVLEEVSTNKAAIAYVSGAALIDANTETISVVFQIEN